MIKLTQQTAQDFLSKYWVQKIQEAGINMDDASYFIISRHTPIGTTDYVITMEELKASPKSNTKPLPTYTLTQLLYKLDEWITIPEAGENSSGPLCFLKDAPSYYWYYKKYDSETKQRVGEYYGGEADNPLAAAAICLLQCAKHKHRFVDIRGKVSYDTGIKTHS